MVQISCAGVVARWNFWYPSMMMRNNVHVRYECGALVVAHGVARHAHRRVLRITTSAKVFLTNCQLENEIGEKSKFLT